MHLMYCSTKLFKFCSFNGTVFDNPVGSFNHTICFWCGRGCKFILLNFYLFIFIAIVASGTLNISGSVSNQLLILLLVCHVFCLCCSISRTYLNLFSIPLRFSSTLFYPKLNYLFKILRV